MRSQPNITLPTITFLEFSGNITEWPSFWDKYRGLIHQGNAKINTFSDLLSQLKDTTEYF